MPSPHERDCMTEFTAEPVDSPLPVLDGDIQAWEDRQAVINRFIQQHFHEGNDFHMMKGKPSLGKAGAEKLATLFHLRATFAEDGATRKMLGEEPGLVCYLCDLYTSDNKLFAEGRGARHTKADPGDPNKTIKMAQKSAQIDAVLRGFALSGRYTQDMEDKEPESAVPDMASGAPASSPAPAAAPKQQGEGEQAPFMATELRRREYQGKTYWNVLGNDLPKQYSQYGITLWPDVAEASQIDLDDPPDIHGWNVRWSLRADSKGTIRPRVDALVDPDTADDDSDVPF